MIYIDWIEYLETSLSTIFKQTLVEIFSVLLNPARSVSINYF